MVFIIEGWSKFKITEVEGTIVGDVFVPTDGKPIDNGDPFGFTFWTSSEPAAKLKLRKLIDRRSAMVIHEYEQAKQAYDHMRSALAKLERDKAKSELWANREIK